jgi:TetR/AcrR family transcriptional repressor of nem operon
VILDDLDNPAVPNVCLMAGSLSADVLGADELRDYVLTEMRQLQAMLTGLLAQAGELPEHFDAETSAETIVTYLQGLFRVARILNDRAQLERQIEALLTGLGL